MKAAGYSETPLAQKPGLKDGYRVRLVNEPAYYFQLFTSLPNINFIKNKKTTKHFIHYFSKQFKDLKKDLPQLKQEIEPAGMIWISWPKKSSKVPTDITEDIIRQIALSIGLVDVKVCAIDEIWSGLKLIIPVKLRNGLS